MNENFGNIKIFLLPQTTLINALRSKMSLTSVFFDRLGLSLIILFFYFYFVLSFLSVPVEVTPLNASQAEVLMATQNKDYVLGPKP